MIKFPDLPAVQKEWCEQSHVYYTPAERKYTSEQMIYYAEKTLRMNVDPESTGQLIAECHVALLNSCDCLTKTPDVQYHAVHCRYRCLTLAVRQLQSLIDQN